MITLYQWRRFFHSTIFTGPCLGGSHLFCNGGLRSHSLAPRLAPLYRDGGIPQGTKLGLVLFAVMVNDLVQSWGARIKFVDDLTVLEVVPRNSPSLLNEVVDYIHAFAVNNNMRLNPRKCKTVTVDFLHYNSCVPRPI